MRMIRSFSQAFFLALVASVFLANFSIAQQPAPTATPQATQPKQPPAPQKSLADYAREARGEKAVAQPNNTQSSKSLSEIAAEKRANRKLEVKISEKDAGELLGELDSITQFASDHSGFLKRNAVKHQVVSQQQVKQYWSDALFTSAEVDRLVRSELVLKKFGFVPPDFTLRKYLTEDPSASLGGFYDFRTKTMNLVNWVGIDEQGPIMAHELTHALQDQNFDLATWEHGRGRKTAAMHMQVGAEPSADQDARRAVIEGQAMVVWCDYVLKPLGRTLAEMDDAMDFVKNRLTSSYDNSLVVRDAPLIFKDSAFFPYREGLIFEMELLKAGGVKKAFGDAFEHPPVDTHQVLEPRAYLDDERVPAVALPDLSRVVGAKWEAYDTGSIGQLDVRVMAQEFGTENDMFTITPGWNGGSYVAVKRKGVSGTPTTADVALFYVSRWKDSESADRFAQVYRKSLRKRVTVSDDRKLDREACVSAARCPSQSTRVDTSEGAVFVEVWPDHTVLISHSFDDGTFAQLRQAVMAHSRVSGLAPAQPDLSIKLQALPGFQAFQERVERELLSTFPLGRQR
jgi:hypothetical protein